MYRRFLSCVTLSTVFVTEILHLSLSFLLFTFDCVTFSFFFLSFFFLKHLFFFLSIPHFQYCFYQSTSYPWAIKVRVSLLLLGLANFVTLCLSRIFYNSQCNVLAQYKYLENKYYIFAFEIIWKGNSLKYGSDSS